jgi:hypothetical protein
MKMLFIGLFVAGFSLAAFAKPDTAADRVQRIAKVQRYIEANGLSQDDLVSSQELFGAAEAHFNKLKNARACKKNKEECPEVYRFEAYHSEVFAIGAEDSDGNSKLWVYTAQDGRYLTYGEMSESGPVVWEN